MFYCRSELNDVFAIIAAVAACRCDREGQSEVRKGPMMYCCREH